MNNSIKIRKFDTFIRGVSPQVTNSNFYKINKRNDITNEQLQNQTKYSNFAHITAEGVMKSIDLDYYNIPKNKRIRAFTNNYPAYTHQSPPQVEQKKEFLKKGQFKPYIKQVVGEKEDEAEVRSKKQFIKIKKIPQNYRDTFSESLQLTQNETTRRFNYFNQNLVVPQMRKVSIEQEDKRVHHPTVVARNSPEWFHINDIYIKQRQTQLPQSYAETKTKILKHWEKSDLHSNHSNNHTFNPQITRRQTDLHSPNKCYDHTYHPMDLRRQTSIPYPESCPTVYPQIPSRLKFMSSYNPSTSAKDCLNWKHDTKNNQMPIKIGVNSKEFLKTHKSVDQYKITPKI